MHALAGEKPSQACMRAEEESTVHTAQNDAQTRQHDERVWSMLPKAAPVRSMAGREMELDGPTAGR